MKSCKSDAACISSMSKWGVSAGARQLLRSVFAESTSLYIQLHRGALPESRTEEKKRGSCECALMAAELCRACIMKIGITHMFVLERNAPAR